MVSDLGTEEGLGEFKKSTKVALIDADTVAYTACLASEYADDLLSWDMYSDKEMKEILAHPNYDKAEHCIWVADEDTAYHRAKSHIQDIMSATDTVTAELYFTSGRNFRYKIYDLYKGNRSKTRYPTGLALLKDRLNSEYEGAICEEYEADDIVCLLKRQRPDHYVLCAIDKDVYKAVPGKHWNYYASAKYSIEPKWVETEAKDAYQFPYIQTLMGDTVDNIRGCPGIGKAKAAEAMKGLVTPCDMWKKVVELFTKKKLPIHDAIRDMRLVNMSQLIETPNGYEVNIWQPPCEA